jgi:DNA-binding MarR family transcriptional regulator
MANRSPRTQRTSLLFDVWLIGHAMSTLIDEALVPAGISGDDYGLYSLLRGWGPATPSQISRWTGMRPTTVSVSLKRMAGRGHAQQQANPDDGRSYLVGLSEAGIAAHIEATPLFLAAATRLAGDLSSNQQEERSTLQRIDAAFRSALELDDRPYSLADDGSINNGGHLAYEGSHLTAAQEQRVLHYIDFIRSEPTG